MTAPLIAFVGTTPNIGTTTAAYAAACRIAELTGLPAAFLCLNLKSAKIHRYVGADHPAPRWMAFVRSSSPRRLRPGI